ncbi:MAG: TraR/DksA C4-type zinc finger protein [Chitinophagales bacterium]|jgi:RNA polymerase-binding transcription factor DksA
MAKKVKKSTKPVAKKAATKKVNAKPTAKKAAPKPAPKKATAKPVAKKSASKPATKKPLAKAAPKKAATKPLTKKATPKPVAKKLAKKNVTKPVAKKVVAKKSVAKPVAKKAVAKKSVTKPVAKKVVAKTAAKKSVAKPVAKKATPKKAAANNTKVLRVAPSARGVVIDKKLSSKERKKTAVKPVAKKVVAKPVAKKVSPKPSVKKEAKPNSLTPASIIKEDKSAKLALRRKKIQEIKNNYESPSKNEEDNFDNYRLPIIGRTRFNDADLNEFRAIINKKLAEAREELNFYQDQMKESEMNDDDIKFSGMEDGGHTNDKEHLSAMANRQVKFIQNLEGALVRIENKTYGICRMTGNLIDKKRLLAVPHATLSMEAKTGAKKK